MELILGALALIMCKKVPAEIGVNKIEQLHNKVKLLCPPSGAGQKPEAAIVRLTIATRAAT